jgi:hypothetical protein
VLDKTRVKALPLLNQAGSIAPAAQACCGVCRTCVTTNIVTLAMAGFAAVGGYVVRLVRRAKPA